jgi:transcriptional regulator with XRE-family HTH domain
MCLKFQEGGHCAMSEIARAFDDNVIPFSRPERADATWGIAATLLGMRLRALREEVDMTQRKVSELIVQSSPRAPMSSSKISRIEIGDRRLHNPEDVAVILDVLEAHGLKLSKPERKGLMETARNAAVEGLSDTYRDVAPEWMHRLIELTSRAASLFSLETSTVPGLLQTDAYTEAITPSTLPKRLHSHAPRLIELRALRRKRYMQAGPPESLYLIKYSALEDLVGTPKVMADQIRQLLKHDDDPNINVRVIPRGAAGMQRASSMTRLVFFEHDGLPDIIYNEDQGRGKYWTLPQEKGKTKDPKAKQEKEEASEYHELHDLYQEAMVQALGREQTREYLHELLRWWEAM